MVTAQQARKLVQQWLAEHGLPFTKLQARTVSFSDLARGSAIFVNVKDWDYRIFPVPSAEQSQVVFAELKAFGKANGFIVST